MECQWLNQPRLAWEKEKIRLEASSNARIAMMQKRAQKAQESKILSEEQKLQIAKDYGILEARSEKPARCARLSRQRKNTLER